MRDPHASERVEVSHGYIIQKKKKCYENENESCGQPSYLAKLDLSLSQLFLISERERERERE